MIRDWAEDRTVVPLEGTPARFAADEQRVAVVERLVPLPLVLLPVERLTELPEDRVA